MSIGNPLRIRLIPVLSLCVAFASSAFAAGKDEKEKTPEPKAGEAKVVSGMSIVGNNETPKSLYIVPWKSSEIGVDAELNAGLLNDAMAPVDKEVFMRELNFHEITNRKN